MVGATRLHGAGPACRIPQRCGRLPDASGRHDELSKSYGLAAPELMVLHSRLELAETEEAFWQGVEETEAAISREHTMWMAKRG
jgi:hypothetical protein